MPSTTHCKQSSSIDRLLDAMVDEVGTISNGSSFHCSRVHVASTMDMTTV
jgi:hypothetical protein